MRQLLERSFTNVVVAEIQERYYALMDFRLDRLLWYADQRGSPDSVDCFVRFERIPDIHARRIAVTWIRRGRILTSELRAWLAATFQGENPTLAEILDRAAKRMVGNRLQTLSDLKQFLGYVLDAYPLEDRLREVVAQVHARHAALRAGAKRAASSPRQLTLALQR